MSNLKNIGTNVQLRYNHDFPYLNENGIEDAKVVVKIDTRQDRKHKNKKIK